MGLLISFEGGDGSGKTVQAESLNENLAMIRIPCSLHREPGGTKAGEALREIIKDPTYDLCDLSELFAFLSARSQLVSEVILPELLEDKIVILDRFIDSSVAYQSFGRGLDRAFVENNNYVATQGLIPDLTFLLDVDPEIGLERGKQRNEAACRIEESELSFHKKLRQGYLTIAEENPDRFVIINTDDGNWNNVARKILDETLRRIGNPV